MVRQIDGDVSTCDEINRFSWISLLYDRLLRGVKCCRESFDQAIEELQSQILLFRLRNPSRSTQSREPVLNIELGFDFQFILDRWKESHYGSVFLDYAKVDVILNFKLITWG